MAGEIVPFGKYRGKPVEALAQDRQYVDWLTAQPWFRDKFANIYTLIINNFQEPADTPEHNKLQALFLDAGFRARFLSFALSVPVPVESRVDFEIDGFDVFISTPRDKDCHVEIKPVIGDDYPAVLRQMKAARERPSQSPPASGRPHLLPSNVNNAVLFLIEYTGVGATCEQFIQIFENAQMGVVFLDEVLDRSNIKE